MDRKEFIEIVLTEAAKLKIKVSERDALVLFFALWGKKRSGYIPNVGEKLEDEGTENRIKTILENGKNSGLYSITI